MTRFDLPYLCQVFGRHGGQFWFYRRNRRYIPIKGPGGRRLQPGEPGFFEAYETIHKSFGIVAPNAPASIIGSITHLIDAYRASPEFKQLGERTRKDYGRYLDILKTKHGQRSIALPREAVLKLRDEYQDTPRTANYIVSVLSAILSYAAERKQTFHLPEAWVNPALRPKKLKTGDGHRPWEEVEITVFRKRWAATALERVLFETFLNTGQRGGDIAPMIRQQYHRGEIAVAQEKTKERVWIPASDELRAVLDPWVNNQALLPTAPIFRTEKGHPLLVDHMRHLMREAIRAAALADDCTLHGLRYSFSTRAIELGLDWQTIEAIVGHRTAEMSQKYTAKRRRARLAIAALNTLPSTEKEQRVITPTERE